MTAANAMGALFGTVLVIYGLVGKGNGYNDVEAPLRGGATYTAQVFYKSGASHICRFRRASYCDRIDGQV